MAFNLTYSNILSGIHLLEPKKYVLLLIYIVVPCISIIYKVYSPTNALFIKLDKVLKFTLKITLTCS